MKRKAPHGFDCKNCLYFAKEFYRDCSAVALKRHMARLELKSKVANKAIIRAIYDLSFEVLKDFTNSLDDEIIKRGIAEGVAGYELRGSPEELKINDADVVGM